MAMLVLVALLVALCCGGVQSLSLTSTGKRVLVAGANGRVGRLVVQELLQRENSTVTVRALVRDVAKAKAAMASLGVESSPRLEIVKCDLSNAADVDATCKDGDAMIWTATGFSDTSSPLNKVLALFKLKFTPQQSIDVATLSQVGKIFASKPKTGHGSPQIVVCSSAGVTRPSWSDDKKKQFEGCADIPIVRLNPFNILNLKAEGEQALRETGCDYAIVRPTGLNDKAAPGARPVFSQGDVAVGRITRKDVADVLVGVLDEPHATGKTMEVQGLLGYPQPRSYAAQLSRLTHDPVVSGKKVDIGTALPESLLAGTYALMQQLVPGEQLAPQNLAMGQTYEQLDAGKEGRLGKRGQETVPIVREA